MKLVMCVLVLAMGSGMGWWVSRRYQARVRQLEKCDRFLARLQVCLTMEKLTTRELFERAAESESLSELRFVGCTAEKLQTEVNFPAVWRESLEQCRSSLALARDDYPPLEALAEIIGAYDAASQSEAVGLSRELLRQNAKEAQEQSRTNGKLSCSLGFLGGIALAILML